MQLFLSDAIVGQLKSLIPDAKEECKCMSVR